MFWVCSEVFIAKNWVNTNFYVKANKENITENLDTVANSEVNIDYFKVKINSTENWIGVEAIKSLVIFKREIRETKIPDTKKIRKVEAYFLVFKVEEQKIILKKILVFNAKNEKETNHLRVEILANIWVFFRAKTINEKTKNFKVIVIVFATIFIRVNLKIKDLKQNFEEI